MKKLLILAALFAALPLMGQDYKGSDPVGTVSYSLPRTVLRLEVEAVREVFHAGPYARYASKYLGVEARVSDETTCTLSSVKIYPMTEADPSRRYLLSPGKSAPAFMALTSQGLVCMAGSSAEASWRFPAAAGQNYDGVGLSSNLTSGSATLYRKDSAGGQAEAVQQQMVVEKSPDARAREAAEMIFDLKAKKVQIATGDTDATFSGEALGAALAEIDRQEKQYIAMFLGYSETSEISASYDVIPKKEAKNQRYIAFRLSGSEGLLPPDNVSGKPYIVELTPEKITPASSASSQGGKANVAYYRIPAVCSVKLSDGVNVLLQTRLPVYQLGEESTIPMK